MINLFTSKYWINFQEIHNDHFVHRIIYISNRHFLLYERADLTASALLQGIRGEVHSFIPCASHLWQPQLVNNPG